MRIGFVGLGKLGLPCAVAIAQRGHEVMGYDLDASRMTTSPQPYREAGPDGTGDFNDHLAKSDIRFGTLKEVIAHAEILFVAVQTPHEPQFEGTTRLPEERADFDYRHLQVAVADIASALGDINRSRMKNPHEPVVAVISTVLPGTMRERILPLCNHWMHMAYNPFFIAMGTTMRDFLNPEFVLLGAEGYAHNRMRAFYREALETLQYEDDTLVDQDTLELAHKSRVPPLYETTIENAELIKVAYNTFIGMKIAFANTLMEICHRSPNTDVDAVTDALKLATTRLISPAYLSGGMGDGGGCHPRDNIAMSWLAQKIGLQFDWFDAVMRQREEGTLFLANLMCEQQLPLAIFGTAFKPGTNLTVGSPALLLKNILEDWGHEVKTWDPHVDGSKTPGWVADPHCILIGTKHEEFRDFPFAPYSVVIDPWRYVAEPEHVEVIRVGVGPRVRSHAGA